MPELDEFERGYRAALADLTDHIATRMYADRASARLRLVGDRESGEYGNPQALTRAQRRERDRLIVAAKVAGDDDRVVAERFGISTRRVRQIVTRWRATGQAAREVRSVGSVYVLRDPVGQQVKIGWTSRDPEIRRRQIVSARGAEVELVATIRGTRRDEALLHARFASARRVGEWFSITPEIAHWLAEAAA